MARLAEAAPILEAAEQWKNDCLLSARGRTAAHEETLDGVNMSGDGARSPTGGAIIP